MSAIRQPKSSQKKVRAHYFTENSYSALGSSLMATGILLSFLAYLVLRSTPVAALGISTLLIGAVSLAIARGEPKIPPQASAILLQSGVENISALVEELGLKSKAIYLPSSVTGDKPKALIPLDSNVKFSKRLLPKRLIVKYGTTAGLLVVTPGSAVGEVMVPKPDGSAGDLEEAVSQVLAGTVNLADHARVTIDNGKVLVEVTNPRLENDRMWIYEILGSPIASIVASVIAQVLDKPVSIDMESFRHHKCVVELKLLEETL